MGRTSLGPTAVRYAGADWPDTVNYFDAEGDGIIVSPFVASRADRETIISGILERVQADLADFGITVHRHFGDAVENVLATTIFVGPSTLSNGYHIACDIDYFNNNRTDIAFVGDETGRTPPTRPWPWPTSSSTRLGTPTASTTSRIRCKGGVLYPESMGLRYSTNNQSEWLADTRFMNQSFNEYRNHGGGRGPQNTYWTMLRQFPGGTAAPAFQGAEPKWGPGESLEAEEEFFVGRMLGPHDHNDHDMALAALMAAKRPDVPALADIGPGVVDSVAAVVFTDAASRFLVCRVQAIAVRPHRGAGRGVSSRRVSFVGSGVTELLDAPGTSIRQASNARRSPPRVSLI